MGENANDWLHYPSRLKRATVISVEDLQDVPMPLRTSYFSLRPDKIHLLSEEKAGSGTCSKSTCTIFLLPHHQLPSTIQA